MMHTEVDQQNDQALAFLQSIRQAVNLYWEQMDYLNAVSADEVARIVTEIRLSCEAIEDD